MTFTLQPPSLPMNWGLTAKPSTLPDTGSIVIGLINNMPDSALEATEVQFGSVLRSASGPLDVVVRLSSLAEVPRRPPARSRLDQHYWNLRDLLRQPLDALIVTGTEPLATSLQNEPYWNGLVEILEFADAHTISSVWSCLAAHAAVLHFDGIQRKRLPHKCCGIFQHNVLADHPLMAGIDAPLITPHSRWNDLSVDDLSNAGYTVVSRSNATGANAFVRDGRSLMVCFQGHPEYEERTILKEYHRDVGRFLSGEQANYPRMPDGYFDKRVRATLTEFQERATAGRFADPLAEFPFVAAASSLSKPWGRQTVKMYENWLNLIASKKKRATDEPIAARSVEGVVR